MRDYVERNAEEHSGVVALTDGDNLITWSHYLRTDRAIGSALLDLGVGRGERRRSATARLFTSLLDRYPLQVPLARIHLSSTISIKI